MPNDCCLRGVVGLEPVRTRSLSSFEASSSSSKLFSAAATLMLRMARWIESSDGALQASFRVSDIYMLQRLVDSLQSWLPELLPGDLLLERQQVLLELLDLGPNGLWEQGSVQGTVQQGQPGCRSSPRPASGSCVGFQSVPARVGEPGRVWRKPGRTVHGGTAQPPRAWSRLDSRRRANVSAAREESTRSVVTDP